jgi:hypothetical protein
MGLQEPELEDLEGVDRQVVVDDVHHLRKGRLQESGDHQVEHHSLAGDVAGVEPSSWLRSQEGGQVHFAGLRRGGLNRRQRLLGPKPYVANDVGQLVVQAVEPYRAKIAPTPPWSSSFAGR